MSGTTFRSASTRRVLAGILRRFRPGENTLRSSYFTTAPSAQNAIDIFEGEWHTSLPGEHDALRAGKVEFFKDPRLAWAFDQIGDLTGKHALELGPLAGAHTYMLEQAGCASGLSIEGNPRAFLKCLLLKE